MTIRRCLLLPLLLLLPAAAAGADAGLDAEWRRFLAEAVDTEVYPHFETVTDFPLHGQVEPQACRDRADDIAAAVAAVPVSASVHYLAYQCAQATGDEAAAEHHLARFGSIARHTLDAAPPWGDWGARPMRVVAGRDIYTILQAMGLELHSEVMYVRPLLRFLRIRVVAWDPEAGIERHLDFDFADTVVQIDRDLSRPVYPHHRDQYVSSLITMLANGNSLAANDVITTREAKALSDPAERVARLRPMAARGGFHSTLFWFETCRTSPFEGCAEGLLDALLPHVEEGHALPTIKLALAYELGFGVGKDMTAAMALLDKANARMGGQGHAVVDYVRIRAGVLDSWEIPAPVQQRLDAAQAAGHPLPAVLAAISHYAGGAERLEPAHLQALEASAAKGSVTAMGLLATHHHYGEDDALAVTWLERAAQAGDTDAQALLGDRYANGRGLPTDMAKAEHWWLQSGEGGDDDVLRLLGYRAEAREDWVEALEWFRAGALWNDTMAAAELGRLYLEGHEGLDDGPERGLSILRQQSDEADNPDARRMLAGLLAKGEGVEKDAVEARRLLEVDAEKGDTESQVQLGMAWLEGDLGSFDRAQGVRWLQRARKDGHADAGDILATWYYYQDPRGPEAKREALALWREILDAPGEWGLNNFAWVLCTAPDDTLRDPVEGLAVARRLGDPGSLPPGQVDTIAACEAANGNFEAAVALQQQAVTAAEAEDGDENAEMRGRLADFRAGKPYLELEEEGDTP
ncbi:hypothetical protein GCM10011521_01960 [Arenimonas soli]|uniref:Sel1 repeat family protein n=1 Tax=Arenimonas soli TaxID=2269504 RepID=A0ABQ1HB77_9GAMM|nr:tetratricopeptide repeat protein [Arenimonas soli]GGA67457.1 hypothetical protein GCM10011521_01960 [Arenimonas soli]